MQTPTTDTRGNPLGRGGYARNGHGAALVASPDPTDLYRSGPQRGLRKLLPYRALSGLVLETSHDALDAWKQNRILLAFLTDPALAARLADAMAGIDDTDSPEAKTVFATFRDEAHVIAKTGQAAEAGTFAHWLTECVDNQQSPIEGLAAGEAVGVTPETSHRVMGGWAQAMDAYGFEALAVELAIVNDDLRGAGTTDRVLATTRPLRYILDNRIHVLPAGTVAIGDFKSGRLRRNRDGMPLYWQKYTGQVAGYAGGLPYDQINHERLSWDAVGVPTAPSQEVGIVIHGDLQGLVDNPALDPMDAFSVFIVDLERGRQIADASNAMRSTDRDSINAWSNVGQVEALATLAG